MSPELSELQYEQSSPLRHRKLIRRALLALAILAGVGLSIPMLLRELERMRVVRLFDSCARTTLVDVAHIRHGQTMSTPIPACWRDLNLALSANIKSDGTVFLGTRFTPDGKRDLLVGVDLVGHSATPMILHFRSRTIIRGDPLKPPRSVAASDQSVTILGSSNLLIRGGVADPSNSSHFTIGFQTNEVRGIIDGWLMNDGSVRLEFR